MLGMTASGVVKSITASKLARNGAVSAEALRFSSSPITRTPCPRSLRNFCHQAAGLAAPQHQEQHPIYLSRLSLSASTSKISGSGSTKNSSCSDRIASSSIILFNHETHVDFRRALRNHAHIHMPDRLKDLRGDTVLSADIPADHADQSLAAFIFHIGQLLRSAAISGSWSLESTVRETLTFRSRNHIHRTLVLVEDFENRPSNSRATSACGSRPRR